MMAAAATSATGGVRPRIAVVGAGFAGLAAALTLQRSCDVVLLEGGARVGGRASTLQLPPPLQQQQQQPPPTAAMSLELGATWLHGLGSPADPNPIFAHAVELGLIGGSPEAERWWDSEWLLPGSHQPLQPAQAVAVSRTLAAWGEVVEGLAPGEARGTTAAHLARAWQQVGAAVWAGQAGQAGAWQALPDDGPHASPPPPSAHRRSC